ncbi:MAG: SGNH/GDSL hydrolase family protein [Clostridia bacterium]|nr:SGNH/GDSL hydrolase family protein [Clostridia bacterium]
MKKVVLLGDSIRLMGYGTPVEEALKNEFEIWQPTENCRFAQYTLRGLFDWRKEIEGADIIHWNNGLWDICNLFGDGPFTPKEQFVEEMVRLATIMKQRAKTVIFATMTPVRKENIYNKNEVIAEYNNAVVPRLRELGVEINDLYTPISLDIERYISTDLIHLSDEGIRLCTDMVESSIRKAANRQAEQKDLTKNAVGDAQGAPV